MATVQVPCVAPIHAPARGASRAYRAGCRCPAALTWHNQEKTRWRESARRRYRNRPSKLLGGRRISDVDPIAVERVRLGDPPAGLSVPERVAATADLTRRGLSGRAIAERLRVAHRTVDRYRARLRAA